MRQAAQQRTFVMTTPKPINPLLCFHAAENSTRTVNLTNTDNTVTNARETHSQPMNKLPRIERFTCASHQPWFTVPPISTLFHLIRTFCFCTSAETPSNLFLSRSSPSSVCRNIPPAFTKCLSIPSLLRTLSLDFSPQLLSLSLSSPKMFFFSRSLPPPRHTGTHGLAVVHTHLSQQSSEALSRQQQTLRLLERHVRQTTHSLTSWVGPPGTCTHNCSGQNLRLVTSPSRARRRHKPAEPECRPLTSS